MQARQSESRLSRGGNDVYRRQRQRFRREDFIQVSQQRQIRGFLLRGFLPTVLGPLQRLAPFPTALRRRSSLDQSRDVGPGNVVDGGSSATGFAIRLYRHLQRNLMHGDDEFLLLVLHPLAAIVANEAVFGREMPATATVATVVHVTTSIANGFDAASQSLGD